MAAKTEVQTERGEMCTVVREISPPYRDKRDDKAILLLYAILIDRTEPTPARSPSSQVLASVATGAVEHATHCVSSDLDEATVHTNGLTACARSS